MIKTGRALDNVFTERLWRTIKYEEIYLKDYAFVKRQVLLPPTIIKRAG